MCRDNGLRCKCSEKPIELCEQLERELNGIARAARKYLTNSTPSAYHMDEWHELKTALAAMPNIRS
jgi:hypothetical protein